eukprot:TRINITY_DN68023_c0_g1_i1.p1 TRINITY_DN68023_c0_g1~~TRINITY_DN68023_c0_g1_i1.p1  ORF type:complete len:221 (+),score=47.30 TRINITY_DN68023_c0_g1_i1:70-732(+)
MADQHPIHHPSAMRNREPIRDVLLELLGSSTVQTGEALEIASGSGAHVECYAAALPGLTWHPSEYIPNGPPGVPADQLRVIDMHGNGKFSNVRPAVALDASKAWEEWPADVQALSGLCALVIASNVCHISPWTVTAGIVAGASRALASGGLLVLYGPFKVDGACTTESNAQFDASLRQRDPLWGYRDVADVAAEAAKHGLRLLGRREMPANNFLLHFVKD